MSKLTQPKLYQHITYNKCVSEIELSFQKLSFSHTLFPYTLIEIIRPIYQFHCFKIHLPITLHL